LSIFKKKILSRIDFFERQYFKSLLKKADKQEAFSELYKEFCTFFSTEISNYYGLNVSQNRIANNVSGLFLPFALKTDSTNEQNTATNLRGIIYAAIKSSAQIIKNEIPYQSELINSEGIYLLEISDVLKNPVIIKDQIQEDVLPGLFDIKENITKSVNEQSGIFVNRIGELSGLLEEKIGELSGNIDKKEIKDLQSFEKILLELRNRPEPIVIKEGETEKAINDLQGYVKSRIDSIDLLISGIEFNPVINVATPDVNVPDVVVDIEKFKIAVKKEVSELLKYTKEVIGYLSKKSVWEFNVVYENQLPVKIIATEQ
jgi:hypothetical protein